MTTRDVQVRRWPRGMPSCHICDPGFAAHPRDAGRGHPRSTSSLHAFPSLRRGGIREGSALRGSAAPRSGCTQGRSSVSGDDTLMCDGDAATAIDGPQLSSRWRPITEGAAWYLRCSASNRRSEQGVGGALLHTSPTAAIATARSLSNPRIPEHPLTSGMASRSWAAPVRRSPVITPCCADPEEMRRRYAARSCFCRTVR